MLSIWSWGLLKLPLKESNNCHYLYLIQFGHSPVKPKDKWNTFSKVKDLNFSIYDIYVVSESIILLWNKSFVQGKAVQSVTFSSAHSFIK